MDQDGSKQESAPQGGNPGHGRRRWRRGAIAALVGAAIAGVGFTAFAHPMGGGFGFGGYGGWHQGRSADPATMQKRAEAMVKWALADIDATDAQQSRIAEIMTQTMRELAPLREKHMEARKQALALLAKPEIDRAALEALRAQELQAAEQVSRRITQSMADAAEVLSPEQRAKLVEKMASRHGRGPRGHGSREG
jgi:Spy/CpxP family protein refolding chaperone